VAILSQEIVELPLAPTFFLELAHIDVHDLGLTRVHLSVKFLEKIIKVDPELEFVLVIRILISGSQDNENLLYDG
jgi:hypothetical protein